MVLLIRVEEDETGLIYNTEEVQLGAEQVSAYTTLAHTSKALIV
jgi:hypothetical protein